MRRIQLHTGQAADGRPDDGNEPRWTTSLPVLKQNNAILAVSQEDADFAGTDPSASAADAAFQACPMKLMPTSIAHMVKIKNVEELQALERDDLYGMRAVRV